MIPELELLRISVGTPPDPTRRPRKRPSVGYFVRGPIPLAWLSAAGRLPGRSLHVGVLIWFLSGLHRGARTVKLTAQWRGSMGLERHAASRALERLQRAGLVEVDRKPGRSPRVTLLAGGHSGTEGNPTKEGSDDDR